MKEFHLMIDDVRDYKMDHTARTSEDGVKALCAFPVTHLYMDHDLGEVLTGHATFDYQTETNNPRSGYDVLTWALESGRCPPNVQLITGNPVGRDNMARALEAHGYERDGAWYRKG